VGSCAGLITMSYKFAVARCLADEHLQKAVHVDTARHHMQRTLNALVGEHGAGYNETRGSDVVVGNPLHGMDRQGMGIIPHLKELEAAHAGAKEAGRIAALARDCASRCVGLGDVSAIQRGGRVVSYLLRAAHEALE